MKKQFVPLVLLIFVLFAACKKGQNEKLKEENDLKSEFINNTIGSWWTYGTNEGTVAKREATGMDSLMLGKRYNYFAKTDVNTYYVTPEYFAVNGEYLTMLMDMDESRSNYIVVIINKEDPKAGETWVNTGNVNLSGFNLDVKTEGKILATNTTLHIAGKTFNKVSVVKNVLKAKLPVMPSYINCGDVTIYFEKGVGILKYDYRLDVSLSGISFYKRNVVDSLMDYKIE